MRKVGTSGRVTLVRADGDHAAAWLLAVGLTVTAGVADCIEARKVLPGGSVTFDTTDATDSDVRLDPSLCAGEFFTGVGPDIWYRLPLPGPGMLRLTTCDPDGFDTDLSVHVGDCESLEMIACNGDAFADVDCQPHHSVLELRIAAAREHFIRVGGFNGAVGVGTLEIQFDEDCPGDLDGDGRVGGGDLGVMFLGWGDCPACPSDLDGDGRVGGGDLGLLFMAWGGVSVRPRRDRSAAMMRR